MNENYFNRIDNAQKAYWLGFITADGSVFWNKDHGNYGFCVGLAPIDTDHVLQLEQDLNGNRNFVYNEKSPSARLAWHSKQLAKALIKRGVVLRKSHKDDLPLPIYPDKFARHFWRGLFDGDGCLAIQVKYEHQVPEYRFSLAGSEPILSAFQDWGQKNVGMNRQKIVKAKNQHGESNTFVFYMNGNRQIAAVLHELYRDTNRYLPRKYKLYQSLLIQNSTNNNHKAKFRYT